MLLKHKDYFTRLSRHDWFYMMADDNTTWRAGMDAERKLAAEAERDFIKARMFKAWVNWRNQRVGDPQQPRPVLSDFGAPEAA